MHDLLIIGGGIGGITASIYAKRYGLNFALISPNVGGMLLEMSHLHNYPGFEGTTGPELANILKKQIDGIDVIRDNVIKVEKGFKVHLENGMKLKAKTLIIATGTHKKHLKLDEHRFIGKGISYCATCDAPMFTGKDVVVYGSGNSVAYSAMVVSTYAKSIKIVYTEEKMKFDAETMKKLKKKGVNFITGKKIVSLDGENFLKSVKLSDGSEIHAEGLIVNIGSLPTTEMFAKLGIKHDSNGFIKTDNNMATSVKGVFAAGDVIHKELRQLVLAASEGATASHSVYNFLNSS